MCAAMRKVSYNQAGKFSILDKFGENLSIRNLRNFLKSNELKPQVLLDVGSGFHASISKRFWQENGRIILLDFEIEEGLKKDKRVSFYDGDCILSFQKIEKEVVDLVIANNVLEHVVEESKFLIQAIRVLKPGGALYINVPSWFGKKFLEYSAFKLKLSPVIEMNDHQRYYNKNQLWQSLRNVGCLPQNIKIKYSKFGLNVTATYIK